MGELKDRLTVKTIDGEGKSEETEIFMSFGLLNNLCALVESAEGIGRINLDPEISGTAIAMCLLPRAPNGRPKVEFDKFDQPGLSMDDAERLLDWVSEHVTGFFLRRVERTMHDLERNKAVTEKVKSIASSLTGTPSSASAI